MNTGYTALLILTEGTRRGSNENTTKIYGTNKTYFTTLAMMSRLSLRVVIWMEWKGKIIVNTQENT